MWDGRECDISRLEERITDMGHCVSFNAVPYTYLSTNKTGKNKTVQ